MFTLIGLALVGVWQTPSALPADLTSRKITVTFESATFADALRRLSLALHRPAIADGDGQGETVTLTQEGSPAEVLSAVCDKLGCKWRVGKRGAILITRTMRQPADRPQAHPAEIAQVAREMRRLLTAFAGPPPDEPLYKYNNRLFVSLTDRQLATLRAGRVLTMADLTARQREDAHNTIAAFTFPEAIQACRSLEDGMTDYSTSQLAMVAAENHPEFGNWLEFELADIHGKPVPGWIQLLHSTVRGH